MNKLNHVAIIMDGNGRWGLKKRRSRNYGHLQGLKAVEKVIKSSASKNIPFLTLYTFSTENWRRPENEINFLFDLIRKSLKTKLKKIIKQDIKINIIGKKEQKDDETVLYRGIATRQFNRSFNLADYVEVDEAVLKDGMLTLNLVRNLPEALKPKKIKLISK